MRNITKENIIEIAEQLDFGFRAFIHKTSGELLFFPNDENSEFADDSWDDDINKFEENEVDYQEIEKWGSSEAFEIMEDFATQVTDAKLKSQLQEALSKNKPFKQFRAIIDDAGDFRDQWHEFKDQGQLAYVTKQIKDLDEAEG